MNPDRLLQEILEKMDGLPSLPDADLQPDTKYLVVNYKGADAVLVFVGKFTEKIKDPRYPIPLAVFDFLTTHKPNLNGVGGIQVLLDGAATIHPYDGQMTSDEEINFNNKFVENYRSMANE